MPAYFLRLPIAIMSAFVLPLYGGREGMPIVCAAAGASQILGEHVESYCQFTVVQARLPDSAPIRTSGDNLILVQFGVNTTTEIWQLYLWHELY